MLRTVWHDDYDHVRGPRTFEEADELGGARNGGAGALRGVEQRAVAVHPQVGVQRPRRRPVVRRGAEDVGGEIEEGGAEVVRLDGAAGSGGTVGGALAELHADHGRVGGAEVVSERWGAEPPFERPLQKWRRRGRGCGDGEITKSNVLASCKGVMWGAKKTGDGEGGESLRNPCHELSRTDRA